MYQHLPSGNQSALRVLQAATKIEVLGVGKALIKKSDFQNQLPPRNNAGSDHITSTAMRLSAVTVPVDGFTSMFVILLSCVPLRFTALHKQESNSPFRIMKADPPRKFGSTGRRRREKR